MLQQLPRHVTLTAAKIHVVHVDADSCKNLAVKSRRYHLTQSVSFRLKVVRERRSLKTLARAVIRVDVLAYISSDAKAYAILRIYAYMCLKF